MTTVTAHTFRYARHAGTDFEPWELTMEQADTGIIFHRPSGDYTGRIEMIERTNYAEPEARFVVMVQPVDTSGFVIVPAPARKLPFHFYVSEQDADAIESEFPTHVIR